MNNHISRVAISILNYNCAPSTIACVQNLLKAEQAASGSYILDIYVSDNASNGNETQQLQRALSRLSNVNYRSNSENLGFATGHNNNLREIFSRSDPDYVWVLNSDCLVDSETLTALLQCAFQKPDVGIWGATLLETDGQTIQCAGGCTYNSWFSSFKQHGHGKKLSELEELKTIKFDYISGASLFFPSKTLHKGLNKAIGGLTVGQMERTQWLNEYFFLFFEELDLAKRLKPGLSLGWAKNARIIHAGGMSYKSANNNRSFETEYHSTLSALKFTALYYPRRLWFMIPSRFLLKSLLLLFSGHFQSLRPLRQAYHHFRHLNAGSIGS